jgi:hypothetical protein
MPCWNESGSSGCGACGGQTAVCAALTRIAECREKVGLLAASHYFADPRLPVEALEVALFAHGQGRVQMHFDEFAGFKQMPDHGAVTGEG